MLKWVVVLCLLVILLLSWLVLLIPLIPLVLRRAVSGVSGPDDVPTLHWNWLCCSWQAWLWLC